MYSLIAWLIPSEWQIFIFDHVLQFEIFNNNNKFIKVMKNSTKKEGIFTFICRFIVMQNSVMKYMTRIGQNTGTLNASKNVQMTPINVLLTIDSQNLNSGNRRINGRNSSLLWVGRLGP